MIAPFGKSLELAVLLDSRLAASRRDAHTTGQVASKEPASCTADLCKRDASMTVLLSLMPVSRVRSKIKA